MPSSKPPTILLFLKVPEPGFVKTRLAKSLGKTKACAVYRQLVARTLSQIPADWPLRIHFAPSESKQEMIAWLGAQYYFVPQPDGDLGDRLQVACEQAFAEKGNTGVILLGGDCPGLTTAHLNECAQHLSSQEPVIGPSEDGGYWLLGLPSPNPELFQNIAWSTPQVLPATLALLDKKDTPPLHLETLFDVDDQESYQKALEQELLLPPQELLLLKDLHPLFSKKFLASAPYQRLITNLSFLGTISRLNSLTCINQRMKTENAVKERYAAASHEVEVNLCCPVDYDPQFLKAIPTEVIEKDYGCGDPSKWLNPGETVLDLGSGTGKICFIASQVVGPEGKVIGVDMTDDMLEVANRNAPIVAENIGHSNVEFVKGRIQDLKLDLNAFNKRIAENPISSVEDFLASETIASELRLKSPLIQGPICRRRGF